MMKQPDLNPVSSGGRPWGLQPCPSSPPRSTAEFTKEWPRKRAEGSGPLLLQCPHPDTRARPACLPGWGLGRAYPGWWQVPALSLSSVPGNPRTQRLAAFPENIGHCLVGLSLSSGSALSHGRIWTVSRELSSSSLSPREESSSQARGTSPGEPLFCRRGASGSWSLSQASGVGTGTGDPQGCL